MLMDRMPQSADLLRRKEVWCATAKMKLSNLSVGLNEMVVEIHLPVEESPIACHLTSVFCDDGVATAEPAESFAERQVEVEREWIFGFVGRRQYAARIIYFRKMDRGRVGGVARSGSVVFFD